MNRNLLGDAWYTPLQSECDENYLLDIRQELIKRLDEETWYPSADKIFEAYNLTDPATVKVIMIGQDPYHNGHAHGLAFSSLASITPVSLRIIFREVMNDMYPSQNLNDLFPHNNLTSWAEQGVFLINPILTVAKGKALSHEKLGWQRFTRKSLSILYNDERPKVFMLWGKKAEATFDSIESTNNTSPHKILIAGHPATASYGKDLFSGCRHFSIANNFLKESNQKPIKWMLDSN